jgi:hypothetical protein
MPPTEPAANPGGVRLTARLPKTTHNGLADIVADLIAAPNHVRTAVIAYDSPRSIKDNDDGSETAIVRITRIEPLTGKAERDAQRLMAGAAGSRLGDVLPLDGFPEWAGHNTDTDDDEPDDE